MIAGQARAVRRHRLARGEPHVGFAGVADLAPTTVDLLAAVGHAAAVIG